MPATPTPLRAVRSRGRRAVLPLVLALLSGGGDVRSADLPVECTVPDAALADARTPFDLALEERGEAVLLRFDPSGTAHGHLLLRMPGCVVVPLAGGPLPPGVHPLAVSPGGARLVVAARHPDGRPEWWYSPDPASPLVAVPAPAPDEARVAGQPILSADGSWAAWVDQKPGTGRQTWHVREPRGAGVRRGDTASLGLGSYESLGYDPRSGLMTLARTLSEIVVLDTLTGGAAGHPFRPGGVASQPGTFRRLRSGWFAWDAYRDDTPWRAVWSVGGRAGRYDAGWSKMIAHAAVNPAGTHAALSLDTRFGRVPLGGEALVLVRLSDGKEIFRRELPRFTRTRVAFLGDRHLAWSEGGRVVVARVPP